MIDDVKIFVGHHSATFVPLTATDHMDLPHTKRVCATDDCAHIEISLDIIDRDLESTLMSIEVLYDRLDRLALVGIYEVSRVIG